MRTLLMFLFLLPLWQSLETISGKVVGVSDGDTIVVLLSDNRELRVRLEGIDCPEKKQDFGEKAKQATATLCWNKEVKIIKSGTDKYGRTLGFVYVDDMCVNEELLKMGLAWHYKKYNSDPHYSQLEKNARERKVGLWSQPDPEAPWDFRHK